MKRVTYWNDECGCWSYHCSSGDAAKLLAAYEDTELEPEEYKKHADALKKLDIEHMHDLLLAERDGKLVVLPPNDPLTIAELREMDGEPVWCVDGCGNAYWCLVNCNYGNPCFYDNESGVWGSNYYGMPGDGKHGLHKFGRLAYRRKPDASKVGEDSDDG